MKVLATTLGETLGDFLSITLNLGYLTGLFITAGFFLLALMIQLSSTRIQTCLLLVGYYFHDHTGYRGFRLYG